MTGAEWAKAVACAVAADRIGGPSQIELADFQADAASRLATIIDRFGGALLADGVGMGKTRVALAVAASISRGQRIQGRCGPVWLCVPARLRDAWRAAARDAAVEPIEIVTHAAMSRGRLPSTRPIFAVIDEAHRFRNPKTARYTHLREAIDCPMLLATATPVVNSLDDLWALLALFTDDADIRPVIGWDLATARSLAGNGDWEPTELIAAMAVRRTPADGATIGPRQRVSLRVCEYEPLPAEAWVWQHLEREACALRLADDWPRGLFVEYVLRRWESGAFALLETVEDLLAFATRRLEAARKGRPLDRATFAALFGGNAAQGVLEFLYPSGHVDAGVDELLADVCALRTLHGHVRAVCEGGGGRASLLSALAAEPAPLLIFTSYRAAAEGIYRHLVESIGPHARVGLVTGAGARATGLGRAAAADILRRFSPRSHGADLRDHERLNVLVATDCVSEGVNLQDCGRVVLADLPASPLAVQQRIGRLLRPGGHDHVDVLLPRPRDWTDTLGMRRRLRTKIETARSAGFADRSGAPLAILTTIDRVADRAPSSNASLPRAARLVSQPTTWLAYARVGPHPWLFAVGAESSFATAFLETSWDSRLAVPCEIPPSVAARIQHRQNLLNAAFHAPTPIRLDDPRARAWQVVREHAESSRLDVLRGRLLRDLRRSTLQRLESLLAQPRALLRFVDRLSDPPSAPTRVELVSALGL